MGILGALGWLWDWAHILIPIAITAGLFYLSMIVRPPGDWRILVMGAIVTGGLAWHIHAIKSAEATIAIKYEKRMAKNDAAWAARIKLADALTAQNQNRYESAISAQNANHQKELQSEKIKNAAVIANVKSGALKLYDRDRPACGSIVAGQDKTNGTAGLDHGAAGAELSKEFVGFLVTEAQRADTIVGQLTGAQELIRAQFAACGGD